MFKLKFKRYKTQANSPFPEGYPDHEFIDPDYTDAYYNPMNEYHHDTPYQQGYECLFCNGPITGAHLVVTTRQNEYFLHPSCILSSFSLILNGFGFIAKLLFNRKKRG